MKQRTIAKYRTRKFINRRFGLAAIQINAHFNEYTDKDKNGDPYTYQYLSAAVTLSDCSQSIRLEFDASDEKQRKERIEKLDTIIGELQKLREVVAIEITDEEKY